MAPNAAMAAAANLKGKEYFSQNCSPYIFSFDHSQFSLKRTPSGPAAAVRLTREVFAL